ncbi:MAG TPA: TPM domain-containing protein [Pirellulales bacterium]|jgi:uncharacterized protein|nr:TPM domain-containing protein [Pirellulales bacterium]
MSRSSSLAHAAPHPISLAAIVCALILASSIAVCPAGAAPADSSSPADRITIPDENTPVIDRAGVIDAATRRQLIEWLHELREKTGAQVKVLTVPSLHGEDIFSFTERHYELWKLGDKEKEKGALIVLALKEHKVRIHTGRGLEGVLPDSWCGTTSRQVAKLYFSHGQYSQGLAALVQAVAARVAADAGVKLTGVSDQPLQLGGNSNDQGMTVFLVVFFLMLIAMLVIGQMQRRQQKRWGQHTSGWGRNNFPYMPGGIWGPRDFGSGGNSGGWGSGGWGSGGGSDFGGGGSTAGGGGGAGW